MDTSSVSSFINDSMSATTPTMISHITELGNQTMTMISNHNITSRVLLDNNITEGVMFDSNVTGAAHGPQLPSTVSYIHFGLRIMCFILAMSGNLLTLIAVARYKKLHNNTNYLICSLAVADLIGASVIPLEHALMRLNQKPVFIPLCLITKYFSLLSSTNNVISFVWIGVDRYIFIAHGLHYPLLVTSTRTFLVIGFTWLFTSIELGAGFLFGHNLKIGMSCLYSVFLSKLVYSYIVMPQFIVFCLIAIGFYIAIARIANKQGKAIAALNHPYNTYEASINKQQKRIAKMMITILGTFFISFIPHGVVSLLRKSYSNSLAFEILKTITSVVFVTNLWINPIIYAWKRKEFNVAFRKLLGLKPSNSVDVLGVPGAN